MEDGSFRDFVLDQLQSIGRVECRPMFGGHGLYHERLFFGILWRGQLFFKTDARSAPAYLALGMKPFRPSPRQTLRTYYEVPIEVLEDPDRLAVWAGQALCAQRAEPSAGRRSSGGAPHGTRARKAVGRGA